MMSLSNHERRTIQNKALRNIPFNKLKAKVRIKRFFRQVWLEPQIAFTAASKMLG